MTTLLSVVNSKSLLVIAAIALLAMTTGVYAGEGIA